MWDTFRLFMLFSAVCSIVVMCRHDDELSGRCATALARNGKLSGVGKHRPYSRQWVARLVGKPARAGKG